MDCVEPVAPGPDKEIDPDLVARNFAAFETYLPHIGQQLRRHSPASTLARNEDGDWDVNFRGEWLYGAGGKQRALELADICARTESRLRLAPPQSKNLDGPASAFIYHLLKRAVDEGIAFSEMPTSEECFHLVSLGLGLGYHLPAMIERTACESICIVEPNLDFLYHSMAVMDWTPLLERRKNWPSVDVITATNSGEIADRIRGHCRNASPVSTDSTLIVTAYPNEIMAAARSDFANKSHLIGTGLGYLVDEMEMTRASYLNLREGDYRIFRHYDGSLKTPAFIIGSGPSIDEDLDFLKANQDKAVIFSCGTAARVLLANGIKPDFQLLLENGELPYDVMANAVTTYGFRDAVMLASTTCSPRIKELLDHTVYYFRYSLSSHAMFATGPEASLAFTGPTVTNTGLSAALALGFAQIYLFGCDLGSRQAHRHHSKHSPYRQAGEDEGQEEDQQVAYSGAFERREVGNFGGIVFSDQTLTWTRDAMTQSIRPYRGRAIVFNCSDGLKIDETTPKDSGSVLLTSKPDDKARDLATLMAHFTPADLEDVAQRWADADGGAKVRLYIETLKKEVAGFTGSLPAFTLAMVRQLVPDHFRPPKFEEYFIRGTVMMMMICIDYYVKRIEPLDRRERFQEICREECCRLLDNMAGMTDWFFAHVDSFTSSIDLEEKFGEWDYE